VKSTGAVVRTNSITNSQKLLQCYVLRTLTKKREQFEVMSYKRLIDIYSSSSKTIDALMKLELPSGVEVEIKV
jgi:small subunit ribosomal protein S10